MARVLPSFPEQPPRAHVFSKYNWESLFDGRVHALSQAEFGDVYVFRNSAHKQAARCGMNLRTAYINGEFILQATEMVVPPIQFARIPSGR